MKIHKLLCGFLLWMLFGIPVAALAAPVNDVTLCDEYGQDPVSYNFNNTNSLQIGAGLANETIYISGTFTINSPFFTFQNCIVKMAPGAEIIVESQRTLNLTNTRLFSCYNMWKEIRVSSDASLQIINSRIEDAQHAVRAVSSQQLVISNSVFNRNYIDIIINSRSVNSGLSVFSITGNQFLCTSALTPPFIGQSPLPPSHSFIGIQVDNVSQVVIGSYGGDLNIFDNHHIGIQVERSAVTIQQSVFSNIHPNGDFDGYQTGIGISAILNSNVFQKGIGNGEGDPATFSGCSYAGILSRASVLYTHNNRFSDLGTYGIRAEQTADHYSIIRSNRFTSAISGPESTLHAVEVERSAGGADFIDFNDFDFNSPLTSINIYDSYNATGVCKVEGNVVSQMNSVHSGLMVYGNNGDNLSVSENDIFLQNGAWGACVYIAEGDNNSFYDNTITGINSSRGLYSHMAQNMLFCTNSFDGYQTGMAVQYNNMGSTLKENVFGNHQRGLQLIGNGIQLGDQTHGGNRWEGSYSVWAAEHTGSDFSLSPFFVNNDSDSNCGDPAYFPNTGGMPSVFPSSGWFFTQAGECVDPCDISGDFAGEENKNLEEEDGDAWSFALQASNAHEWDVQRYLFRQIAERQIEVEPGSDSESFYQSNQQSEIGLFYQVEALVREAFSPSFGLMQQWQEAIEYYTVLLEKHRTLHAFASDYPEIPDALSQQLSDLQRELKVQDQLIDELYDQLLQFRGYLLEEAMALNQSIAADSPFGRQQQTYNAIRLALLKEGSMKGEEKAVLEKLAASCFEEAGSAVFDARSLLAVRFGERQWLQFAENCSERGSPKTETDDLPGWSADLEIHPNPFTDQLSVSWNTTTHTPVSVDLEITDLRGVPFYHQQVTTSDTSLLLSAEFLPSGAYVLRLISAGEVLAVQRIIKF
jgi:hypothetical protein